MELALVRFVERIPRKKTFPQENPTGTPKLLLIMKKVLVFAAARNRKRDCAKPSEQAKRRRLGNNCSRQRKI